MALKLGQTVETSTQQQGLVRYIGTISVAEGIWLGIELPLPEGKNDGSIRGERYFTCPPLHGLFIREGNVSRVVSQPPPKAPAAAAASAPAKAKAPTPAAKPRPSSVAAAKPAPRPSSMVSKRQSVAPATSRVAPARAPVRKASIASSSITSASETTARSAPRSSIAPSTASSSTLRSSRDTSNIETLQTRIRHLEKQVADEQERNRELSQARDERDRFRHIIDKVQLKCQTLVSENNELKAQSQVLQTEIAALQKAEELHDTNVELATIDKLVAEEEKDRLESELGNVRMHLENAEMDVELLREEVRGYTEDLTPEQRENAGFKQLQYENGRLRDALHMLKEQTMDQERELRSVIQELEAEASQVAPLNTELDTVKQDLAKTTEINEHLRGQLDDLVELQEELEELTTKNQELEDHNAQLDNQNRELEALRELNEDIDAQREGQVEDLQVELDARDAELSQQSRVIQHQNATIIDQADLITKLRELAFEFQGKAENAESSRTMTEAQAKDTTSRFNEVMDLNRRLRASNVQATNKEITSELRKLAAAEANEKLAIYQQTESKDFENSESLRSYFTAKSIAAKAGLVSTLLSATDRQLSYNGGLEEASARVHCNQATYHLELIKVGSDRLWSAMSVASLEEFGRFGPMYQELLIVEKALDQGLDALKADEVRFDELSASFGRSVKMQDELVSRQTEALLNCKEDETLSRVLNFYASLRCLDMNYAIVTTMLRYMVVNSETLNEEAEQVLERVESSALPCNRAMLQSQKLVKVLENLKADSLRPVFQEDERGVFIEFRKKFSKAALAAPEWSQKALKAIKAVVDSSEDSEAGVNIDINVVAGFTDKHELEKMEKAADQIELWIEFCSVLMNNVEFEHGPSPWAQKAMETADARKKHDDVLAQLEQLKAERKATQTSLIESTQLIETKQLAIDHLEAKYREASKKVSEQKQLDDKLEQATQNAKQATEQLVAQQKEMARLRELAAQTARSDAMSPIPDASSAPARQAAEDISQGQRTTSTGTMIFIEALQNENHWLRQRENNDIFGRSMRHMATTFKDERRMDQRIYEDLDEESCFNLIGENENALYQPRRRLLEKRAENRRLEEEDTQSSPIILDNVKFGSVWGSPSPGEQVHRMHLHVQYDEEDERWLDFGADISEYDGPEIFW